MHSSAPLWMWPVFGGVVLLALFLDLAVFNRKAHAPSTKEAIGWTLAWIALSLAFNVFVYVELGGKQALEFFTAYVVEKALSVDNLFVFYVVFGYFAVADQFQHRVLFWGVVGALITRGAFIFVGVALVSKFSWMTYVFGGFLVFTGGKILFAGDDDEFDPKSNPVVRLAKRFLPVADHYDGAKFFTRVDGRRMATPLLLVLVVIESTDVVFAVDSIPAVLGVTQDPFIVMTSNIFAILGLRSLYFVIAQLIERIQYLNIGLGLVLVFVGGKMIGAGFGYHVPIQISLGVIALCLGGATVYSLLRPPKRHTEDKDEAKAEDAPLP